MTAVNISIGSIKLGRDTGLPLEGGRGTDRRRSGGYTGRGIVFKSNDEDRAEVQFLYQ